MTWTRTFQGASRRADGSSVVLHPAPCRSSVRRRRIVTTTKPLHVATCAATKEATEAEGTIQYLLENNRTWAESVQKQDPELFPRLAKQQTPKFLWIGCADSRVPANQVLGLQPGEVFVQRNVGNQATHKDINCMACLEYAVTALKVEHVIVCGHRECGAVKAALTMPTTTPGLVNLWISSIRDVRNNHEGVLKDLDMDDRTNRLCEFNVVRQVFNVCTSPVVQAAWNSGQRLAIHGLVYNVHDGRLEELTAPITGLADLEKYGRQLEQDQPRQVASSSTMRAVVHEPNKPMSVEEVPTPKLTPNGVRIRVKATAINRADVGQRGGSYSPPPGASPYLGLEATGTIVEVGPNVKGFKRGERVMALTNGGGYAEEVVVDAGSVLPVPESFSDEEAACFMETYLTVFLNIFMLAKIPEGGSALVHGGGSGIGTSAISLLKEAGMTSFVTAGSDEKCQKCLAFGASHAINYMTESFAEVIQQETNGAGVDTILDSIGGPYLNDDLAALKLDGSIVFIGMMGGPKAKDVDLGMLMEKRAAIIGSTLRNRSDSFKANLVQQFKKRFGHAIEAGRLRPVVHRVLPLEQAEQAHEIMESSKHFGKIVLRVQ